MKYGFGIFVTALIIFISIPCKALDIKFNAGSTVEAWQSDSDDKGFQFYIPVQIGTETDNWQTGLVTAALYSKAEDSAGPSGSVTGFSDTKLNMTYQLTDRLPIDIYFGLDANLPTGKTGAKASEVALYVDSDLFAIKPYGEGFGVNPTVVVAKTWDKWAVGCGLGYNYRGKFDYSDSVSDYNPGDITILTAQVDYTVSSALKTGVYAEYGMFGEDEINGVSIYQQGNFTLAGVTVLYKQIKWDTSFNLEMILRDKGKVYVNQQLATETDKSLGNELKADFVYRYLINDQSNIKGSLGISNVKANDYPENSAFHMGDRNKYTLGCSYFHSFNPNLEGHLDFQVFVLNSDKGVYNPTEDRTYKGLSLSIFMMRYF